MASPIQTAETLQRGVKSDYQNTYRRSVDEVRVELGSVMALGLSSDKFEELYAYRESAPGARHTLWGEAPITESYRARDFTVVNRRWTSRVEWLRRDRELDQLGDLMGEARESSENFAFIPEEVFFQIVTNTTDADLLPTIPNAPDGAALYSTTDGASAARFGIADGNIIASPAGIANGAAVRGDFWDVMERFKQFQNTKGKPLHGDRLLKSVTIYYAATLEEVFREAFLQGRTLDGGAAVTNTILESGIAVKLVSTQRITNNKWTVWLNDFRIKGIFEQVALELEEAPEDKDNSDRVRDTGIEAVNWESWRGYGVGLPIMTIQVDN